MNNLDNIIDSILKSAPSPHSHPSSSSEEAASGLPETQPSKVDFRKTRLHGNFAPPADRPTQDAGHGIAFDFNCGARLSLPGGRWLVSIRDTKNRTTLYNEEVSSSLVVGSKKFFFPTRLEVTNLETDEIVVSHDLECRDRDVTIILPGGTLGDAIGWFSYAIKFQEKHCCRLTVVMNEATILLFSQQYPSIRFCSEDEYELYKNNTYATYYMGLFFDDESHNWQPSDFRLVGLHRTAAHILDVDPTETPPRLPPCTESEPPIEKPYVVIATQASSQCKYWNNPYGWRQVINHLKILGYEIVCIDRTAISGHGNHWNYIPNGVRDETGDRLLLERAYWLRHAAFFIGLSSGLSWLAWAARIPVIMISGFTHPINEFSTPYRIFNPHVCNSCWHDVRTPFQHNDTLFCPRHANTDRHFECTKLISAEHVIAHIDALHQKIRSVPTI